MNQLKTHQPETLAPSTKEEISEAKETQKQILTLIKTVKTAETDLEHNYVNLGQLIYKMQSKTLWVPLGYDSWRSYFDALQEVFGKGRTQLYGYVGTVKSLSPFVDDKTLVDMGISKAKELKRAVDQTGKTPSEDLIKKAVDQKVTGSDFRQAVMEEFHIVDHNEKGEWYDLRGIYLTPDEKEEMLKCFDVAKKLDPPVPHTLPGHAQMKEVLFRLIAEFMGQYSAYGGDEDGFNQVYQSANEGVFD